VKCNNEKGIKVDTYILNIQHPGDRLG